MTLTHEEIEQLLVIGFFSGIIPVFVLVVIFLVWTAICEAIEWAFPWLR